MAMRTISDIQDQIIPSHRKWNAPPLSFHHGIIDHTDYFKEVMESLRWKPLPLRIKNKTFYIYCEAITRHSYEQYIQQFNEKYPIETNPMTLMSTNIKGECDLGRLIYFIDTKNRKLEQLKVYIHPSYFKVLDKYFDDFCGRN